MATYYAICNVNGPISHRIQAGSAAEAADFFADSDPRAWIDSPDTHAEDDLGIEGEGLDEVAFAAEMEAVGYEPTSYPDGNVRDGWVIWGPAQ